MSNEFLAKICAILAFFVPLISGIFYILYFDRVNKFFGRHMEANHVKKLKKIYTVSYILLAAGFVYLSIPMWLALFE